MENEVTDNTPPCKLAEQYLANSEIEPVSDLLPRASARYYIPRRCIEALFADEVTGVRLEGIFLCPCHKCVQDGGPVDDRSTHFNELREKELRADYATIFALLIYVHRPGLIRVFQQHGLKLHGTEYLQESDFDRLKEKIRGQPRKETIADLDSLKKRVLRYQYSFLVRTLKPYSDIKVIPAKELLPIKENETPKGKGSFAEVHCFEFQDDDYRSKEFGRVTKFARKVFMNGEARSSAKEWYNLQGLSKATNHQHLMPALGAYWHGDIFFILQEEADMSLHDYLSRGQGMIYKSSDLWRQVQGLAEGINTLHNLYQGTKIAYHQDLKPANILIIRGIMKIADFGLLEFKPVLPDETGSTGVVSTHNTGYYAPPRQGQYTRKDDIWSLACIISELATADIQGRDEIPKYREARTAEGQRGRDTPSFFLGTFVKNQVLDKHRQLQRIIQIQEPTGQDDTTSMFQRKFYTAAFFALLNSMFRHDDSSGSLLAVPGQVLIPDAGKVAETLEAFRKEAMSPPLLNVQGGTTGSSSQGDVGNTEVLVISMNNILSEFQNTLSQKEEERFGQVNRTNMTQFLVNLQAKQRLERRQQGLKRLSPFLEAFEQFGELFGKFCVPDRFMAFIWGPVKYMLELTQDHREALNQIVDVYGEVGRQQPSYDELLLTQLDITQIISAGYSDIIHVHAIALQIFKHRRWKDIFSTSWPRCRIQISRYISSMASRLDAIVHGGNFEQPHTAQGQFTLEYEQNPIRMDDEQRKTVYTWLKPIDMENEQYHLKEIRNRCSLGAMPGRWLMDHMTFKEWFDPQFTVLPTLLWLHGSPGVGKSVLASLVIEEAQNLSPKPIVLFFYFKQDNDDRDTFVSMARTLLAQLLKQDTGVLDYMYNSCCKNGEPFLNSRSLIEELLLFALSNCNSAYIILDGLDECASRDERKTVVDFFRKIIENHDGDQDADRLRCMFVSRKDSARKDFCGLADIAVDLEKNEDDIDAFCQFRSHELGENLRIPEDKLKEIASIVSAFAHGIFLVAELVWINLCGQSSIDGLEFEWDSLPIEFELNSLPIDLDRLEEMYKKIMRTILNNPVKAHFEQTHTAQGQFTLSAVPGQVLIPEAGKVAETLEAFRKEAISAPLLNVQGGATERTVKTEDHEVVNSDSGYASGTYQPWNKSYTFSESKLSGVGEESGFQEHVRLDYVTEASDAPKIGLYDTDTTYSPSETPSLPPLRSKVYIDDLASQLFRTVALQKPDLETLNRVSKELPDILRAFSLKIGYRADPAQCHVAYFLHKYRRHIQQSFEDMFPLEPVFKAKVFDSTDTGRYKISRFFEGLGSAVDPPHEEDSQYQDLLPATADQASSAGSCHNGDTEDDVEPPEPMPYRNSVLNSPAFDWLITTLLTEVNLTRQRADVMQSIRSKILGTLPFSHEVSRKKSSTEYRAVFEIDWDPLSFVKSQKYRESPDKAIERSITLTGSPEDAQALTTGQYLAQTWPTNGGKVMRIVADVIRNTNHYASGILPDGTELQACIEGDKFMVHATGIGDSLVEVAQQFAWLGAALRPSPFESGIAICSPAIRNLSLKNISPQGKPFDSKPYAEISCVIEFDIQEPLSSGKRGAGHCWHSMFRNPVMVKGYPIMAKYKSGLGLEIPLNLMSGLAGSKYATEFDGKAFIKGFSAMLIATEASKDLLLWHYCFNVTGERISYFDHGLEIFEAISLQQLDAARHVVGWCGECNSYAGAANVLYDDIGSVYLPKPHADCILEKISLSGGKLVTGGVSFAVGVHHIPPHLNRNSYLGKLDWIATRFVVFWDERDKRGWLVNGTSALLHLVRASIQHHIRGDFSSLMTFDPSQIKSPAEWKPNSASQVLSNPENLEVEVQLDKVEKTDEYDPEQDANGVPMPINRKIKIKRTYKLFCDVVEEHYRHLEQIMDYQVQAGGQNGVKIKLRFRDHLEGWDFLELAAGHDPSPRLATLDKSGYGWVNLVRSIEAITVIGSGFGEMIRPIEFDGMCPNWKTLPTQRYYLAATVFDLEKIIKTKKFGGSLEEPIKLVQDLLWHSPQETVAPCPCRSGPGPQEYPVGVSYHHDPVQVFYSTTWKSMLRIKGPELYSTGAVVFGHPVKGKFCWKKQGDEHAEQSEPPPSLAITHELNSTAVSAETRASSTITPAQVAHSSSASYGSSSGVTRYASASASATESTPVESAADPGALTASTSSEISSGILTSAEQIPLSGMPGEEIQETRQGERRKSLFRKLIGRRKKAN